jgi:uncharacterized protein (TIGR02145 family)
MHQIGGSMNKVIQALLRASVLFVLAFICSCSGSDDNNSNDDGGDNSSSSNDDGNDDSSSSNDDGNDDSSSSALESEGTFTDSRDDKTYKYVKVGNKIWMAQNLNYDEGYGSKCYNDNPANCNIYGRLYKWDIVMNGHASSTTNGVRGICPSGWHVPTTGEWDALSYSGLDVGLELNAGTALKATSGWDNNGNGEDKYGFAALPGGYSGNNSSYYNIGKEALWWTCSESSTSQAYYWSMSNNSNLLRRLSTYKTNLYSLRCVKNS